jgi:hypothetical protein
MENNIVETATRRSSGRPLELRRKGPQANDSIDAKFPKLLVRPVYLLRLLGLLLPSTHVRLLARPPTGRGTYGVYNKGLATEGLCSARENLNRF